LHYHGNTTLIWKTYFGPAPYLWQKQFLRCGTSALERKNGPPESHYLRTIAALREKLQRENEVVAELMEEHIQPKKELGEL